MQPFTPEIANQIIAELNDRGAARNCPLCNSYDWVIATGYTRLYFYGQPGLAHLFGQQMPLVALTCNVCGNTHLINLLTIGLGRLWQA